jgi:ureidoglycolate dehydrogenase (NAD+)
MPPILVPADLLRTFAQKLLMAVGVSEGDAGLIADSLVESNLRGIDTHGVTRLKVYCERIEKKLVKARPHMIFRKTRPGTGVLDGDCGPGQVVTCRAMDHACELARETGIGAVAIQNSAHFGAAAYYTERAARKGLIGCCRLVSRIGRLSGLPIVAQVELKIIFLTPAACIASSSRSVPAVLFA